MKRIIILVISMALYLSLYSVTINGNLLSIHDIKKMKNYTFSTERVKKDKKETDQWQGVLLKEILQNYKIMDYKMIQFQSTDRYLIKLSKPEIDTSEVYFVFMRNGKDLPENELRIVSPKLRDMYWISRLNSIDTIEEIIAQPVKKIIPVSVLTDKNPLINNPKPFVDVKGYYLKDLLKNLVSDEESVFTIMTYDSLKQELVYSQYLEQAVLITNGNNFDLRSPAMPGGMWQKDLQWIRFDDMLIYFPKNEDKPDLHQLEKILINQKISTFSIISKDNAPGTNNNKTTWSKIKEIIIKEETK